MRHADVFAGAGGFKLAARRMGWENVFHSELIQSKRDHLKKEFPESISYGDISTTDFTIHRGSIDVLSGGFPCQDASNAKRWGKGQQGLQGSRTGLLFEMCRVISEVQPKYVVAENVENFLRVNGGRDFATTLIELSRMGYNAEWRICRASDVGAPHHRARLYIVAYSNRIRLQEGQTFFSYVHEEITPISWMPYGAAIQISGGVNGRVNPQFYAWMMGYPKNWLGNPFTDMGMQ